MTNLPPSKLIIALSRRRDAISELIDGLNGKPFAWGDSKALAAEKYLGEVGVTLVTVTQCKRRGHKLKKGVKPVGSRYFSAPIQRQAPLFVLNCQTTPIDGAATVKGDSDE